MFSQAALLDSASRWWEKGHARSVLRLTSFEELRVQVRQAAGDGVGKPTAAHPVAGLKAQVATQRALEGERRKKTRTSEVK